MRPTSNATYLYLLVAVAFFILALSCINFINLTTARSAERAKEVGIRKVMGSTRPLLVRQFIIESVLICFVSFLLALAVASLLKGGFNQLIGQSLNLWDLFSGWSLFLVLGGLTLIGLIAGIYPALVISSIHPAVVLKGSYKSSRRGIWLRNALIVLQFFITITMISGTLFVAKQMQYLADKDLGFDKEQLIVVRQAQAIGQNLEAFKTELNQLPEIVSVGSTNAMIGDFLGSNIFRPRRPDVSDLRANVLTYDDDYMSTMKFRILQGRGFEENFNDSLSVIINESAVKELGLDNPIGEVIQGTSGNETGPELRIVGVVENFNFTSLHTEVSPLVITNANSNYIPIAIAIRSNTDQYGEINSRIEAAWDKFVPDQRVRLSFLDQELNTLYEADQRTGTVFRFFTYVAIIIAFIGLFSLATYVIELRTKEICVRKILGASLGGIFMLLSSNFFRLVLVALALSVPLSFFAINKWLERFAYHIEPDWFTFAKAGLIALGLVLLAIGYQSIRISMLNPSKSLRTE